MRPALLPLLLVATAGPTPTNTKTIVWNPSTEETAKPRLVGVAATTDAERLALRERVRTIFNHGWDQYARQAFPMDELRPLSCSGVESLGGIYATAIDSLDTLVLMGNVSEFRRVTEWLGENAVWDRNTSVSVFETNIRAVGGLLAGHILAAGLVGQPGTSSAREGGAAAQPGGGGDGGGAASGGDVDGGLGLPRRLPPAAAAAGPPPLIPGYNGSLLRLAEELADRLLPAFDTPTGIPFGSINLRHGTWSRTRDLYPFACHLKASPFASWTTKASRPTSRT
eukprot:SAG22_NODE_1931_length_3292_cov_4.886940_2_plen_282_part_00